MIMLVAGIACVFIPVSADDHVVRGVAIDCSLHLYDLKSRLAKRLNYITAT
jgi:hypothetical protein